MATDYRAYQAALIQRLRARDQITSREARKMTARSGRPETRTDAVRRKP